MKILGNVIKSPNDSRVYIATQLKNGIECLIISDREAKKSSAAMSVGVGSFQDPFQAQGLAHYLQHMLFMGTKKYPGEDDYQQFLAKNFGHSNAYTALSQTNYHFEVASNAFQQTLDKFAQFFICPLMSQLSSQRQLNAVHSEHSKNLLNDDRRKYHLTKHLAIKGHPMNKFSTGDKKSLANPNLKEMLHNFYNKNYSANLMKLVVCGNQAPQEISKIVECQFSQVPNKKYNRFKMFQRPYSPDFYNKIYKILPIQDKKNVQISWTINDKSKYYKNPLSSYISHIIGHQGKGSLLQFLIQEGLATALSAGGSDCYELYSEFHITIILTKKGVQNVKNVIQYTLDFVQMLKKTQPQKWVFDEIQTINQMKFNYLEKKQGISHASGLAKKLQKIKIQEVLAYPYFMYQWKPQQIKQYLQQMSKQNMFIFLQAKEVENQCNLVQPIYGTKFGIDTLDNLQIKLCPAVMPLQNPFIPNNFDIFINTSNQDTLPKCILNNERFEVYYKKDHRFNLPKMVFYLNLCYQGTNSAKQSLCRKIYTEMLTEYLRQLTYFGETASTESSVGFVSYSSLRISFMGFRDSVLKLIKPYFSKLLQFEPTNRKYFSIIRQKTERKLQNYFLITPYKLAQNITWIATRHKESTSPVEQLNQIKNITFDDIVEFGKKINSKLYIKSFISGSLQENMANNVILQIQNMIKQKSKIFTEEQKLKIKDVNVVKLQPGCIWIIQEKISMKIQENSAVVVYFQYETGNLRSKVLQQLCLYFIKEPTFDYLRTKQQLGYVVMCIPDDNRGVLGMNIVLQSNIKTSYELIQYIDKLLSQILIQKLKQLNETTFNQFKMSLKISKQEKDKNLLQESVRHWREITKYSYVFDRKEKEIQQIDSITLSQFKNFINLLFYINPKRLEIHLMSQKNEDKNVEIKKNRLNNCTNIRVFSDADSFRQKMDLYPEFYSHL